MPSGGRVPALAIRDLSYRYGSRTALSDLSLAVPQSAFVALLGPNGAGKTTLFSIVTRLFGSRRGQVSLFGHDLHAEPAAALRSMGVVFQPRTVDPDLTVLQNLHYHAALHGLAGGALRLRIESLLDRVGLRPHGRERVKALSGGRSAGSRSPARWSTRPACFSWTKPLSASTFRRGGRSPPSSMTSCAKPGLPRSGRRTSSTRSERMMR